MCVCVMVCVSECMLGGIISCITNLMTICQVLERFGYFLQNTLIHNVVLYMYMYMYLRMTFK